MSRERWRRVRSATGYRVSSHGRVKSVDRVLPNGRAVGGVLLSASPDRDGYLRVKLGGERTLVHHLVLEAFVGPRPAGMEGCHGPGGQQDNRLENLRWDTHQANERDKRSWGSKASREQTAILAERQQRLSPPSPLASPASGELR